MGYILFCWWVCTYIFTLLNMKYIHMSENSFFYLFIFRQRRREGEREGEKHQCVVASHMSSPGDLAHNPSMCPDWESDLQPFRSQASTQSTQPHQPGHIVLKLF